MTWCFLTRESESAWGASSTCVCGDNVKTVQKLKTPKRATGLSSADDGHFGILQQSFRPTWFILGWTWLLWDVICFGTFFAFGHYRTMFSLGFLRWLYFSPWWVLPPSLFPFYPPLFSYCLHTSFPKIFILVSFSFAPLAPRSLCIFFGINSGHCWYGWFPAAF